MFARTLSCFVLLLVLVFSGGCGRAAADESRTKTTAAKPVGAERVLNADLGANSERLISLDLHDTDIHAALRIMAEVLELNIVTSPGVSGRISSLRLANVPARQAFELILRTQNLYAVSEGRVIMVYPVKDYLEDARKRLK